VDPQELAIQAVPRALENRTRRRWEGKQAALTASDQVAQQSYAHPDHEDDEVASMLAL